MLLIEEWLCGKLKSIKKQIFHNVERERRTFPVEA